MLANVDLLSLLTTHYSPLVVAKRNGESMRIWPLERLRAVSHAEEHRLLVAKFGEGQVGKVGKVQLTECWG